MGENLFFYRLAGALRVGLATSGQSQRGICKATGVSQATLSEFLNLHRDITLKTASTLADHLGLELCRRAEAGHWKPLLD